MRIATERGEALLLRFPSRAKPTQRKTTPCALTCTLPCATFRPQTNAGPNSQVERKNLNYLESEWTHPHFISIDGDGVTMKMKMV